MSEDKKLADLKKTKAWAVECGDMSYADLIQKQIDELEEETSDVIAYTRGGKVKGYGPPLNRQELSIGDLTKKKKEGGEHEE